MICIACHDIRNPGDIAERRMVGGYLAILCTDCCNRWTEHVASGPEWFFLKKQEIRVSTLVSAGDMESLNEAFKFHEAEMVLYQIAKEWVARESEKSK